MPYIMVMGSVRVSTISGCSDESATIHGLNREERESIVVAMNKLFRIVVATHCEPERIVKIKPPSLMVLVNKIHGLLGYDVVSHSMTMTNTNRELISFTMYRKSSSSKSYQSHEH